MHRFSVVVITITYGTSRKSQMARFVYSSGFCIFWKKRNWTKHENLHKSLKKNKKTHGEHEMITRIFATSLTFYFGHPSRSSWPRHAAICEKPWIMVPTTPPKKFIVANRCHKIAINIGWPTPSSPCSANIKGFGAFCSSYFFVTSV